MKTFLTIAAAAAVTYALVRYALEHAEELQGEGQPGQTGMSAGPSAQPGEPGSDAADAPSSVDDIPTLQGVRDAEPQRPEPLRESDLNVAQNAPL